MKRCYYIDPKVQTNFKRYFGNKRTTLTPNNIFVKSSKNLSKLFVTGGVD